MRLNLYSSYYSVCGVYISLCTINCTMGSTHIYVYIFMFTHGGMKSTYVLRATLLGLHNIILLHTYQDCQIAPSQEI